MGSKGKMQTVIAKRMAEVRAKRGRLVKEWSPYIGAVGEYLKENKEQELTEMDQFNIAQCLDNALLQTGLASSSKLFEATYADNIDFLGIQLPIIAALLPSLVLNEIAIVQAIDRRQAAVFYLDVLYGTDKGTVTAGDTMIGAKTGHATSAGARKYATTIVEDEALTSADDVLVSETITGNLEYDSVMLGTIVITDGTESFTDAARPGSLVSSISDAVVGWAAEDGSFSVTFATAPASSGLVSASYQYHYDQATDGVPSVNINLTASSLTAMDFPLQAAYSVGACLDLEKAHGVVLEDELVKYLGGEIKFEIDHYGIDLIEAAAISSDGALSTTGNGTWTATPTSGQEWLWKKYEFLDKVEKASNGILSKTLRGFGNFIVCGNNVARVVRQMGADHFKPAPGLNKAVPTGPIKLGTLDGRTVIQDPFLTSNRYIVGFRGDNYLFAGFIYAPYIPLFTTPTLITADLMAQKGFLSSAGFKVINPGLYTFGTVDVSEL